VAHVLWLSAEAKAAWKAFHHRLEPHLAPDANLGAMTDWAGKLLGPVVRLSGVLHMAEHALEPQPWTRPISRVTMERASAIGAYLIPHAQAAFALMGGDEASGGARYLLDWIVRGKRKKPESFTRYEAFRGTRGRFERPENLAAALGLLEHHHVIRPEQSKEVRKVGRPAERYLINPKLYGENAQNAEKGTAGLSAEGIDSIFDIFALGDSADDEPTGVGTTAHQARAGDCGYDPDDVESF
jgi:putative DNA primase/helicase